LVRPTLGNRLNPQSEKGTALLSAVKPADSLIADRSAERRATPRRSTVRSCTFCNGAKQMTCKTYIGTPHRESVSGQSLVTVCDGQKSEPLPLRLDLFNQSPTGFSWGYGGSGPAQLALALLADALGDDDRAIRLHQAFKFKVVAAWPEGERWWMTAEQIAAVVKVIEQEAVPIANEQDGAAGAASRTASLSTGGPDAA
jgi:hypothetical protein